MTQTNDLHQALLDLVHISMRRTMHEFTRWMNRSSLSNSQLGALMRLYYHGDCPISNIGDNLGITAAAASQMVDRLVQNGLLQRDEDPDDRRVKRVTLTTKGNALVQEGVEARLKWLRDIETSIPKAKHRDIIASLSTLTEIAKELEETYSEAEKDSLEG
jgi:DNA-binding MarR family transcriptional regulator